MVESITKKTENEPMLGQDDHKKLLSQNNMVDLQNGESDANEEKNFEDDLRIRVLPKHLIESEKTMTVVQESPLWPYKTKLVRAARVFTAIEEYSVDLMHTEPPETIFLVNLHWYLKMKVYLLADFKNKTDEELYDLIDWKHLAKKHPGEIYNRPLLK